jgi:hypothetical protein
MACDRYLTRSDIAKILKVSLRQAGQLMREILFFKSARDSDELRQRILRHGAMLRV